MNFTRRCQRIYEIGCLACRRHERYSQCQVHHINLDDKSGQKRLGDEHTIGLCPWHHDGLPPNGLLMKEAEELFGPSRKWHSVAFRKKYGSATAMLAEQNKLIAEREACVVGRIASLPEAQKLKVIP